MPKAISISSLIGSSLLKLSISTHLELQLSPETDVLLQIEAADIPEQAVLRDELAMSPCEYLARVSGQDAIGERIWLRSSGQFLIDYQAEVAVNRLVMPIEQLTALPPHMLPGETIPYIMDSVYCPARRFQFYVNSEFGSLEGGALISAMRDWIGRKFTFAADSSDVTTTALESFVERRGVCRDFAHVLITLARAAAIPARYASVYAPNVSPQDFHAAAEVFLADYDAEGGTWHLVDATGMAQAGEMAKIAIGRDAADVSFITSYGELELTEKLISVKAV